MPTYSSIALNNFLEPKCPDSLKMVDSVNGNRNDAGESNPRHLYISPALYATPEQTPISEYSTPDPPSPSPYVVNHKRRRGGNGQRSIDFCQISDFPVGIQGGDLGLDELAGDSSGNGESLGDEAEGGENDVEFCDLRDHVISVMSEEANDFEGKKMKAGALFLLKGSFSMQSMTFPLMRPFQMPLHLVLDWNQNYMKQGAVILRRLKREIAEKALTSMHGQWERIHYLLSQAGLIFPAPPAACDVMRLENNLIDQFTKEVVVTRFVAEAVGRGLGRAEAEENAAMVIESKDQEIMRLRDRLQYYEMVNHEMSQRKLVEVARRQQERKRNCRRWLWSIMGLSIGLGASFLAYPCIPQASKSPPFPKSGNSTDASCIGSSDI